jgi:DNA polymerase-3 subunit beta
MFIDSKSVDVDNPDVEWYIEPAVFSSLVKACKGQESVIVKVSERNVSYRIGATTIFTLQTMGVYPQYQRAIPQSHSIDIVCDKSDLVESMQRAALFAPNSQLVKIKVNALAMDVQADNMDKLQKSVETLSCTSNAEIVFGVNSKFFLDCVGACSSEEVTVELTDASRPIVIKDSINPDRVILCMPMAL